MRAGQFISGKDVNMSTEWTKDKVLKSMIEIVKEVSQDFESGFAGDISAATHLGNDLDFESIDVVEMSVSIEQCFKRRKIPFQKLFEGKDHYYDLTVQEIADFLSEFLSTEEE